jgi:hypothetical protein
MKMTIGTHLSAQCCRCRQGRPGSCVKANTAPNPNVNIGQDSLVRVCMEMMSAAERVVIAVIRIRI